MQTNITQEIQQDRRRNFNSIDVGKIIAATLVVGIHCNPFQGLANDIIIEGFARLAVPFFFIVSAFLFFRKNPNGNDVLHFLKRLLILYGFWFVFNLPQYYIYSWPSSVGEFVHNFFLDSTFGVSWFLMALMEGVLVTWLLSKRLNNALLFAFALIAYIPTLLPTWHSSDYNSSSLLYYVEGDWMHGLVYIVIGKALANHERQVANKAIGGDL